MSLKQKIGIWWMRGFLEGKMNLRVKLTAWLIGRRLKSYLKEENRMDDKKWWKSKTVWANTLTGIVGIITAVTTDGNLDPKTVGILATAVGFINIILRFVTEKPLAK